MVVVYGSKKPPDVSADQKAYMEFVKLIRKLRWTGMEDDAERVQSQLAILQIPPSECGLAVSYDTDSAGPHSRI